MALIEIARFDDLQEAQIASATLRSAGFDPMIQNEQLGTAIFYMQRAFGGFRIWVHDDEAAEARSLIESYRASDTAALDWTHHPEVISAAPASLFWAVMDPVLGGWAWARLHRGFSVSAVIVILVSLLMLTFILSKVGLGWFWP